jgi:hypothetical protein
MRLALAATFMIAVAVPASAALAGSNVKQDRLLTGNERATVLAGMTKAERATLGPLFKDNRSLIVGYARNVVELDQQADGSLRPRVTGDAATILRIDARTPTARSASVTPQTSVGTYGPPGTSLYQSLTVTRHCSTCLQWDIHEFYNWYGTSGLGFNNGNRDRIATAWGSNYLALKTSSYYFTGHYTSGATVSATDQYVNANAGVGWGFREFQHPCCSYYSDWGYGNSSVVETSYHNVSTNFVGGYAHTGIGNSGGSITFAFATINFNGNDDFEWQFSLHITT